MLRSISSIARILRPSSALGVSKPTMGQAGPAGLATLAAKLAKIPAAVASDLGMKLAHGNSYRGGHCRPPTTL